MKSNWSIKSQSLFHLLPSFELQADSSQGHKLYYDESFYLELNAEYPLSLKWLNKGSSTPKELLLLFISLGQLSASMPWPQWIKLRARELENFLRDHNHIAAIPMELLDLKKVDFFLELLFEEHFKLRVHTFLQQIPSRLAGDYLGNHRLLSQLFQNVSSYLYPENTASSLFALYQIGPREVIFLGEKALPVKFCQLLSQSLAGHFALSNLKFVAIEL